MVFYLISGLDSTMSLSGFITVTHLPTADIQSQTYKQRARVFITLSLDISYCLTSLSMDNIEEKYVDSKQKKAVISTFLMVVLDGIP